jgi:hypothetical protein
MNLKTHGPGNFCLNCRSYCSKRFSANLQHFILLLEVVLIRRAIFCTMLSLEDAFVDYPALNEVATLGKVVP